MAASAYELVTLALAKDFLNVESADTEADTTLQNMVNSASQEIIDYCGSYFKQMDVDDEISDGDGSRFIYLRKLPILALGLAADSTDAQKLAKLVHRQDVDSSWTAIETDIDHIFIDPHLPYIELYDEVTYAGRRTVKVDYQVGFSTVPQGAAEVCLEIVQQIWQDSLRSKIGRLGVTSQTHHGATSSYNIDLRPAWKERLNAYRIHDIGAH